MSNFIHAITRKYSFYPVNLDSVELITHRDNCITFLFNSKSEISWKFDKEETDLYKKCITYILSKKSINISKEDGVGKTE